MLMQLNVDQRGFNPVPLLTHLQTEQTQIRQLLQELPNLGLICLLMEI